ncbi:Histone-lysine N-methyltransferase, H3 lysine-9 specific [Exophiala dermatitidis]
MAAAEATSRSSHGPAKRKQFTPSAGPVLIEISSDEEDNTSTSLPPAKRQKSQNHPPVSSSLSATRQDRSLRELFFPSNRPLAETPSAATLNKSRDRNARDAIPRDRDGVSGLPKDKGSQQQVKSSPWNRLSDFAPPRSQEQDGLVVDSSRKSTPRVSSKSKPPLLERIAAVREAARSETPPAALKHGEPGKESGKEKESLEVTLKYARPLRRRSRSPVPLTKRTPVVELEIPKTPSRNGFLRQDQDAKANAPAPKTPSSSQKLVSVDIPLRRESGPAETHTRKPSIEVRIPQGGLKAQRRVLLQELKKDTSIAIEKPELVRRVFGQTGFSPVFSVDEDENIERMRKMASKKKRTAPTPGAEALLTTGDEPYMVELMEELNLSKNKKMVHPADTAREVLTRRFQEEFDPPLTFANDVNERRLHGKFQFTDRYIIREGVRMAPPGTNAGCDCVGVCDPSTCACFAKEVPDEVGKGTHKEQIQTYVRRPDNGMVVLSDTFIASELDPQSKRHFEVTECNELCGCGPDCINRVVGKGRTVPLEIFQTAKCGFGVRSPVDIVKGQFIELYLGEVITEAELCRREATADAGEPSYIYSLDWFGALNSKYHVDGKYFGSAMRFVNHSCNPNARCFIVQLHKGDKKVYYLPFFAIKDIKAGVEIRIDYQPGETGGQEYEAEAADEFKAEDEAGTGQYHLKPNPKINSTAADVLANTEGDDDLVRCYCGEKNCRKYLWSLDVKARRRRRKQAG